MQSYPGGERTGFTAREQPNGTVDVTDTAGVTTSVSADGLVRDVPWSALGVLAAAVHLGPARDFGAGRIWFAPDGARAPMEAADLSHALALARTEQVGGYGEVVPTVHVADIAEVEAYHRANASRGPGGYGSLKYPQMFALARLTDWRYVSLEVEYDVTDCGGFEGSTVGSDARVGTREQVISQGLTNEGRRALGLA